MSIETKYHKPTLGAVAICKNEEQDLLGFLENLNPWVEEIVIVDDGSTDASIDILRNAGSKVKFVEHRMTHDYGFAGQRNLAIAQASADWLLHMDIDERVTPDLALEMTNAIQTTQYHAFRYHRLNFFLHRPMKGCGLQDWNNPQLAKRGYHHFENPVHEVCVIKGGPSAIGQLKSKMWHLNDASYLERMEKSVVYCQYVAKRLAGKRLKIKWYHFLVLPGVEFIRKFILRKGYVDQAPGLLFALHSACAMFKACAILWDQQNAINRNTIEIELTRKWAHHLISKDIDK